MAQKTEYLNVAKIEYFNVAHVSKTLEFSTLGASYRSTRLSSKLSKKLLWRLIFANKTTYSYQLIVCESSSRVITEFLKNWILIVDKEEPLMVAVLVYQLVYRSLFLQKTPFLMFGYVLNTLLFLCVKCQEGFNKQQKRYDTKHLNRPVLLRKHLPCSRVNEKLRVKTTYSNTLYKHLRVHRVQSFVSS